MINNKQTDYLSSIPNEYEAITTKDIQIPEFTEVQIPQFHPSQVWLQLEKVEDKQSHSAWRPACQIN